MGDVNTLSNAPAEFETANEAESLLTTVEATADWCHKGKYADTTLYILRDGSCGFLDYKAILADGNSADAELELSAHRTLRDADPLCIFASSVTGRLLVRMPREESVTDGQLEKLKELWRGQQWFSVDIHRPGGFATTVLHPNPESFDAVRDAVLDLKRRKRVTESALLEDGDQQSAFDVANPPQDLFDFYDEYRGDTFDDDNFSLLRDCGNITDTQMFTFDSDSDEKTELVLNDLTGYMWAAVDRGRKNLDPWVESMFDKLYPNGFDIRLEDFPCKNNRFSDKFISACMNGDVYEFFDSGWSSDNFSDLSYNADCVDGRCKRLLRDFGFPSDIYWLLARGEADEESPLAEHYDALKEAFCIANNAAHSIGAADACIKDFDSALRDCCPAGTSLAGRGEDGWPIYHITAGFLADNIDEFWYAVDRVTGDDNSDQIQSALYDVFIDLFRESFDEEFREPYYGWDGFDEEQFNDYLYERLNYLDIEEKSANESLRPLQDDSIEASDPDEIANSPFFRRVNLKDTVPMSHYTIAENGWIYGNAEPDFEYDYDTEEVLRFGVQNSLLRIMCRYDGEVDIGLPTKHEGTTREQRDAAMAFINRANRGNEYAEVNVFINRSGFIDTKYERIKLDDPEDVGRLRALM